MTGSYQGKTVFITGAANGIGQAMARGAAGQGANLILGDLDGGKLNLLADELRAAGKQVHAAGCDVRHRSQIDELVNQGISVVGAIDTAFINAGVLGSPGDVWTYPEAEFRSVIEINLIGSWQTLCAVTPGMIERGKGQIVATASAGGLVGAPGLSAYVASKHAVVGLVRSAALEVGSKGLRVNALCPGMTDTAMLDRVENEIPGLRESLMTMNPSGRVGDAAEVARAALWLGSDQSTFVNGHTLVIDGGFTAG